MESAVCTRCRETLPVSAFARDLSKRLGRKSLCLSCDRLKAGAWYERVGRVARKRERFCECGAPTWKPQSPYCKPCSDAALYRRAVKWGPESPEARMARVLRERARVRSRPSPAERGYDRDHRRKRAALRPEVEAGMWCCVRCGDPIEPGEPWDLGHDDRDRSRHTGPEHRRCNRATKGRGGRRVSVRL